MGAGSNAMSGEFNQRLVKLAEGYAVIVEKPPDGLRGSKSGLLGTGNIFNGTAERGCGSHMLLNQPLITPIKAGINPANG